MRSPRASTVIGLDLAWGTRALTGVAIVEPFTGGGRLVELASLRTDAELDSTLAGALTGPCLVAIDAPLVVRNATGRRPCEAVLSRAFAAQHAGTYPSNTGLAAFADGGRAAALALRHGLEMDATVPYESGQRRAIEVYPHSATVALFDLPRVLAYKARPSRTLAGRKLELGKLVGLLAGLAEPRGLPLLAAPPGTFEAIKEDIGRAPTGAALRRLEDPLDAVVCAYVGLLFQRGLACVIGEGGPETDGAIVTPIRDRHVPLLGVYGDGCPTIH